MRSVRHSDRVAPGRRILVGLLSLVVAPVGGLWAAVSLPNPPGTGPGIGQAVVGVLIPVSVSVGAARSLAQAGWGEAVVWAFASLAVVGVLLLLVFWIASSIG
jgi:hypothetical protein